jgi:hypothetical protein
MDCDVILETREAAKSPHRISSRVLGVLLCALALALSDGIVAAADSFTFETVDTGYLVGSYCSIAMDCEDIPHISYYDGSSDILMYATKSGGVWALEPVDESHYAGQWTSIGVDLSFYVHISYWDAGPDDLKYALRYPIQGDWDVMSVDTRGDVGSSTSIAVTPGGWPHICYADLTAGSVKYAKRLTLEDWNIETIDGTEECQGSASIAVNSYGEPCVAYCAPDGQVRCASKLGGVWDTEIVDSLEPGYGGYYTSMAVNSADRPSISYVDLSTKDLKYAWRGHAGWMTETVDADGHTGYFSALALDSDGNPHIAYQRVEPVSQLKYAVKRDGFWSTVVVVPGGTGFVHHGLSLAVDTRGTPHIVYYAPDFSEFRYARGGDLVGIGPAAPTAGLRLAAPRPNPTVGNEASIAFTLEHAENVELHLFDCQGRLIDRRARQCFPAGPNVVSWAPTVRAPGVHYLQLRTESGDVAQRAWVLLR